jgi:hypothetical protein
MELKRLFWEDTRKSCCKLFIGLLKIGIIRDHLVLGFYVKIKEIVFRFHPKFGLST